ncbi:MAG: ATP/cobalamin adenosyltransferase [Firmicutes bacterium]|nr:ATP/cobalamin adenosyltransferase [Bacillota bacterium]
MNVYTKTGDKGETSLYSKQRIAKEHIRVEAYGTVDEANTAMGLARALLVNRTWADMLTGIQRQIVVLNTELATDGEFPVNQPRLTAENVTELESSIDSLEQQRIPQCYFITPGECLASAALDLARTMVRRAERCTVKLSRSEPVSETVLIFLNRLSDLLFVMARCVEQEELVKVVTNQVQAVLKSQDNLVVKAGTLLDKAKLAVAVAQAKAKEIGVPMVVAIVDQGGNLVAEERMDGALLASLSLALDKAYTAAALRMSTEEAAVLAQPGKPLYGLPSTGGGRMVVFGGGVPLTEGGVVVGGLGVSGGSVDEDVLVASAGLAAWRQDLP